MILKDFYTEKRKAITEELSYNSNLEDNTLIHLYTDNIFKTEIVNPVILFKYDAIDWETSSEKTYKADVNFCLYIVLPKGVISPNESYEKAFEFAHAIDKAIISGKTDLAFIDTNATFKVHEKQCTNEHEYWDKNDYFIWEITYKTTLIENTLKKRYTLLKNGVSDTDLIKMGYAPLTDEETNGRESNYIKIDNTTKVAGNLYLNSVTSNNAAKEDIAPSPETTIITNPDLDDDDILDLITDAEGNVIGNDPIEATDNTVSGNPDEVKTIKLNN